MDPAQILQMIMQLLQGSGMQGGAFPSGMNRGITGSLQSSLASSLLGGMMPGMAPTAPPTMLMADMHEMRRRDSLRQRTHDQFYMSPVLERMLTGAGMKVRQENGTMTFMGKLANQAYRGTFGAAIKDPFMSQAQRMNEMRDIFSGTFFGRSGAQMQSAGLSEEEITSFTRNQYTQSHGPSIFARGSSFSAPEMFQVQRLGAQRGLFMGANTGDISRRTEQMARTIKMGQAVFQTMDKEGVLDALQALTQGAVPMSDTGSLNRVMFQVAAMARSANVSVQLMSRLASEGAALFQQVGIGGTTGANLAMQTARTTQSLTASGGPGVGALVSAQTVADAGGRQAFSRQMQQRSARILGSDYFTENSFLLNELEQLGQQARHKAGISDEFFSEMQARLAGKGGLIGAGDSTTMMKALAKARGVGFSVIRTNMQFGKNKAAAKRAEDMDPVSRTMLENRMTYEDTVSSSYMTPEKLRLFKDSAMVSNRQYDEDRKRALAAALILRNPGMAPGQAMGEASAIHGTVIGSKRGDADFRAWQTRTIQDHYNTRRTAAAMEMMEQDRPTGGFLQKVFNAMGGDMSAAAFMRGAGEAIFGKNMTQREVERAVLKGEKFVGPPTKRQWADFMYAQGSAALWSKVGGDRGLHVYANMAGMTGRINFGHKQAREDYNEIHTAMQGLGQAQLDDVSDGQRKDFEESLKGKNFNLDNLKRLGTKYDMKLSEALKLAKQTNKVDFERFERSYKAVTPDMEGKTDILKKMKDGQPHTAKAMAVLARIKKNPDAKVTDEEWKMVSSALGFSFKDHKHYVKDRGKAVEAATSQLKGQLERQGLVLEARFKSPLLATDVAVEALKFADKSQEDLKTLLGEEFGDDFEALIEGKTGKLAEALQSKEGAMGAFGKEFGKIMGRAGFTEKQLGAAQAYVAKKHGLKLGDQMTQFSVAGNRLKVGQLQTMKEAGAFDPAKQSDNNQKEMIKLLQEIAESNKTMAKGKQTKTGGGGDSTTGAIVTSPAGPGDPR